MYNIPKVAPKAISKPKSNARSKTVKLPKQKSLDEQKRLEINQRERERTILMNKAFDELRRLLGPQSPQKEYSKAEILSMINSYITFLHRMANDEEFFQKYSNFPINTAFQLFLFSQDERKVHENHAPNAMPAMICQ